ncbi:MAG TPA: GGDEF domain-containing protein [Thermoanaerobaculia bacterium]|nr:GGDEF domain-containing protein [Thermoanaerobaculia bacterium]
MSPQDTAAAEPSLWRKLWSAPEPELSSAGYGGELLVAGVRLLIFIVLLYFPIQELMRKKGDYDPLALLTTATAGLVLALIIYSATQRQWGRTWIGFASSLLDISLVSALLAVFLAVGRPHEATNNLVIFPVYFLAIAATSLRYDPRICQIAGALALVQYAAVVGYADWRWDLNSAAFAPFPHGMFHWGDQVWRLTQLLGATVIATTIVVRARELRLLSTRDRFTGLLNRAVFNEQLEREAAFARREDGRFAVAMVDIDHFKRFNDSYGHAGGDEALRMVAGTLRDSCRATDVVARYGGEEFGLILPGVMSGRATDLLERIRRVLAVKPIHLPNRARPVSLTVSIGVAIFPEDGKTPAEVLRCADQRLYQAKAQGRDRVVGPMPGKGPQAGEPAPAFRTVERREEEEEETVSLGPA